MSEDPGELQRFYAETVEPLVAYDEQYETDLVQTLETFLDCDGNVAGTAQRLFTHRHTIRYRLERVRELSGLDVGSTDGREKLGLGLKAMRVLGIATRGGPARERAPAAAASRATPRTADGAMLGIITGSGTYALPGFEGWGPEPASTQWGEALVYPRAFAGAEVCTSRATARATSASPTRSRTARTSPRSRRSAPGRSR